MQGQFISNVNLFQLKSQHELFVQPHNFLKVFWVLLEKSFYACSTFYSFYKNTPIASFYKKFNSWKRVPCNIYIFFILICMKNTKCVHCRIKSFEYSNCNSVERKEHYDNKFLNLSESTESNIPSFLVVLEFIIRIGNAKTLESAIYMLISTFGSSFHWDWIARYYTCSYFYTNHNNNLFILLQKHITQLDIALLQIVV